MSGQLCFAGHEVRYQSFSGGQEWYCEVCDTSGLYDDVRLVPAGSAELRAVYRERARLVAFVASVFPSRICANDPAEPGWPVVYVETPEGQLSWHLSPEDLDLFDRIPQVAVGGPEEPRWDGHTTEEKYERLARLDPPGTPTPLP